MTKIFRLLKHKSLLFVVFATGACVLILEVVATRILSPYFGNTIFTVSSVIGVVLAALSAGYYVGGNYADKNPHPYNFYFIILLSGFATFIIQILNVFVLPVSGYYLPVTSGPVVMSIVLFGLPSFLLGTLSPFAIKLQEIKLPKTGIGKLSGQMFFYSTLGSIFGTFLAGFYLIPTFGIDKIVLGVGCTLSLIGISGILLANPLHEKNAVLKPLKGYVGTRFNSSVNKAHGISESIVKKKYHRHLIGLSFALVALLAIASVKHTQSRNIIYSKDGLYEKISILNGKYLEKPARILLQDRSFSSAVFLDNPFELAFPYTRYVDLYKIVNKNPKTALFIGGGAYSMPSYLTRNISDITVDVAEIEPGLYNISQQYFGVPQNNSRLFNYIGDGRRFLHDSQSKYDIIFSDVYSTIYSIPHHFTTKEFFELSKSKLSDNGVFIANIIGDLSRRIPSLTMTEIRTFQNVFSNSYFIAVNSPTHIGTQNIIFLGINSNKVIDFADVQNANKDDQILGNLNEKLINVNRFNPSIYPILTDNYSPVENITKALIDRSLEDPLKFNGEEAMASIGQQLSYGPRHVTSEGHDKVLKMIKAEVETYADILIEDNWNEEDGEVKLNMTNVIGKLFIENKNRIIIGSHYDSLIENPGANNSASGVSVMLEIIRVLKTSSELPNVGIDFVFFDGEEGYPGKIWVPYGSEHFVKNLNKFYPKEKPQSVIILDMVCDKELDIYYEKNSSTKALELTSKFFDVANNLYPDYFHYDVKYEIADDHTAFNNAGIPSTLLIDFDYPHYNTNDDTLDKCSAESLESVGNSLLKYIYSL